MQIEDERDALQKEIFTKWANSKLNKINRQINDLYEDFRDGINLIKLLEILSGEQLTTPLDGNLRIHSIGNVNIAVQYLKGLGVRLENIDPSDIVDGNGRLTLGLLWMIILRFEVSSWEYGWPHDWFKDFW